MTVFWFTVAKVICSICIHILLSIEGILIFIQNQNLEMIEKYYNLCICVPVYQWLNKIITCVSVPGAALPVWRMMGVVHLVMSCKHFMLCKLRFRFLPSQGLERMTWQGWCHNDESIEPGRNMLCGHKTHSLRRLPENRWTLKWIWISNLMYLLKNRWTLKHWNGFRWHFNFPDVPPQSWCSLWKSWVHNNRCIPGTSPTGAW